MASASAPRVRGAVARASIPINAVAVGEGGVRRPRVNTELREAAARKGGATGTTWRQAPSTASPSERAAVASALSWVAMVRSTLRASRQAMAVER